MTASITVSSDPVRPELVEGPASTPARLRRAQPERWGGKLSEIATKLWRGFVTHILPPLVIIGVLLALWQALGSRPGAALSS